MSLRFYRRIKIAPGLTLNLSKRGISMSAGVRGAHVTLGSSGARTTVGVPGTGLYYTRKLGDSQHSVQAPAPGEQQDVVVSSATELRQYIESGLELSNPETGRRYSSIQLNAMLRRMERQEEYERNAAQLAAEDAAYAEIVNLSRGALPVPDQAHWQRAQAKRPFKADSFSGVAPVRSDVEVKVRADVAGEYPLPGYAWVPVPAAILALLAWFAFAAGYRWGAVMLLALSAGTAIAMTAAIRRRRRETEENRDRLVAQRTAERFDAAKRQYEQQRAEYEKTIREQQQVHDTAESERIGRLRKLLDGDRQATEATLQALFEDLDLPVPTEAAFVVPDARHVLLDVDLPEIEDCIKPTVHVLLKSGTVKTKPKNPKTQREEYTRVVTGLAIRLCSEVFNVCPLMGKVIVSGYTRRLDRKTGHERDEYIFSIVFDKPTFAGIDFTRADPVAAFRNFDVRWSVSSTFRMKEIDPFTVADFAA